MADEFTAIKGFTRPRLPRLGKIHLGVKKQSAKGGEYPAETDYFVVPEEVAKVYGDKPKQLEVIFPVESQSVVAPYAYKKYGAAGLSCKGDGETYTRWVEAGMEQGECPCPDDCPFAKDGKGRVVCKAVMNLFVMLPTVHLGGVYQIDTGSWHSITNILSQIQWAKAAYGRSAFVPFYLRRVPKETQYELGKKQTHYPMELHLPDNATIKMLAAKSNTVRHFLNTVDERLAITGPNPREIEAEQFPKDIVEKVVKGGGATVEPPVSKDPEVIPPAAKKPTSQRLGQKPRASEPPPMDAESAPSGDYSERDIPVSDDGPPDDLDLGGVL